jgi:hypothetical protein
MKLQRTGLFILAAGAAAMLFASAIDVDPFVAMALEPPHARPQDNAAAPSAYPVSYNYPGNTPTNATWASLFSASWR